MDYRILIIQAITSIISMFVGAFIYRKGIQGESVIPEKQKQPKSSTKDWAEIRDLIKQIKTKHG